MSEEDYQDKVQTSYDTHGCYIDFEDGDRESAILLSDGLSIAGEADSEIKQLHAKTAAQAQDIDELKAHVNALREALFEAKGHIRGPEEAYRAARESYEKTPAQSLSAHDAAIEEEVIAECDNHLILSCGFANALDDMPRKHNV